MIYLPQIDTSTSLQVCRWILDTRRDSQVEQARNAYRLPLVLGEVNTAYMHELFKIGHAHWTDWQNAAITYYMEQS